MYSRSAKGGEKGDPNRNPWPSEDVIYFDFDMSKSTNTVVYFDWKTFVENVAHNLCCQWKSQSHLPAHVRMRLYH